MLPNS
jgi:hypothetical protein